MGILVSEKLAQANKRAKPVLMNYDKKIPINIDLYWADLVSSLIWVINETNNIFRIELTTLMRIETA